MNCREIIEKYLKENGYDGLCSDDGMCCCEIGDLIICDGKTVEHCEPGNKEYCCKCGIWHDFHIIPEQKEEVIENK